jgi:hypothetical protein
MYSNNTTMPGSLPEKMPGSLPETSNESTLYNNKDSVPEGNTFNHPENQSGIPNVPNNAAKLRSDTLDQQQAPGIQNDSHPKAPHNGKWLG